MYDNNIKIMREIIKFPLKMVSTVPVPVKFSPNVLKASIIKIIKVKRKDKLVNKLFVCNRIDIRTIKPTSVAKLKLINNTNEITPMKRMLKPFLGSVEYLMYQK